MIHTELFKLRTHRTPWVLLAVLTVSLVVAPIYFVFRNPADPQQLLEPLTGVFLIMAPLLGAVFGGWICGHEFRQGTLRRVLGTDARRGRLIAAKAAVGLVAAVAGLAFAFGVGALASIGSAATFGETLDWDGVLRDVASGGFLGLITAALAFGFSVLLRSDTYAILGSLGLIIIVGPLLSLIPRVGKYVPSALANDVSAWIAGSDELVVSIVPASLGLAASLALVGAAAVVTFQRRDV